MPLLELTDTALSAAYLHHIVQLLWDWRGQGWKLIFGFPTNKHKVEKSTGHLYKIRQKAVQNREPTQKYLPFLAGTY